MLTFNRVKYLSDFTQDMTYDQTTAIFGSIPVGEYCLMLGLEQQRKAKGLTKDEVLSTIYTYTEAVSKQDVLLPPSQASIKPCCGGGKVR